MFKYIRKQKWTLGLLCAIVALFALLPAGTASAQIAPDPQRDPAPRLERVYERMQLASERLQLRFQRADLIMAHGDEWVAFLQEQGVDTTDLERALNRYADQVAVARNNADAGAAILAEHAGFDDDGNVTDVQTAADTLRDARARLVDGHQQLRDATQELHEAIKAIRDRPQEGA